MWVAQLVRAISRVCHSSPRWDPLSESPGEYDYSVMTKTERMGPDRRQLLLDELCSVLQDKT